MSWTQLAVTYGVVVALFAAAAAFECWSRRRFRRVLAEHARQRWEILQQMPAGSEKDRVTDLHTRIAEITDGWSDR